MLRLFHEFMVKALLFTQPLCHFTIKHASGHNCVFSKGEYLAGSVVDFVHQVFPGCGTGSNVVDPNGRMFFLCPTGSGKGSSLEESLKKIFPDKEVNRCFSWILGMGLAMRYNESVHKCSFAYVKINCLAILLVTFLGWWKRDPFKGCWWPPTFGDKKLTFEAPSEPLWSRPYMGRGWYLRSQPLKYPHQNHTAMGIRNYAWLYHPWLWGQLQAIIAVLVN